MSEAEQERGKNPAAVALGKLGRGRPKVITEWDRAGRIKRLEEARARLARIRAELEREKREGGK